MPKQKDQKSTYEVRGVCSKKIPISQDHTRLANSLPTENFEDGIKYDLTMCFVIDVEQGSSAGRIIRTRLSRGTYSSRFFFLISIQQYMDTMEAHVFVLIIVIPSTVILSATVGPFRT